MCRNYISRTELPITSVTIRSTNFGRNLVSPTPKSPLTFFENILMGLEAMEEDIIYFCESDILYHEDHFKFEPTRNDTIYYNGNYWVIRLEDGFATHYDMGPLSGLVAFKKPLITHYKERVEYVKEHGYSAKIGYEPFTHNRIKWKNWYNMVRFYPPYPNLDLYYGGNMTRRKWSPDKFVNRPAFWYESTIKDIPGWDNLPDILESWNLVN